MVWPCIEKRIINLCGQESDGGGGAREKKERIPEAEMVG